MAAKSKGLKFDKSGVVLVRDDKVRDFIAQNQGEWKASVMAPGLLVLRKAGRAAGPGIVMSGEVRSDGWLVELISFVCNTSLTGKLTIVSHRVKRELYFDSGSLRLASSTARRDLLGEFLVSEGVITKAELKEALAEPGKGKRLGQVLVARGCLSRHDLYEQLKLKIEKIFLDALVLRTGIYHFDEDIDVAKLPASISMETRDLLAKGEKMRNELIFYRQTVPWRSDRAARDPSVLDGLLRSERDFVRAADGEKTLSKIDDELELGMFETVRITRQLIKKGMLEVSASKDEAAEAGDLEQVMADFNRAIGLVYKAVEGRVDPGELTGLGRDFINKSVQQLSGSEGVVLDRQGQFKLKVIRKLIENSDTEEGRNFIVMILSRYISFILFTANSYLPVGSAEKLSARVYGTLDKYS